MGPFLHSALFSPKNHSPHAPDRRGRDESLEKLQESHGSRGDKEEIMQPIQDTSRCKETIFQEKRAHWLESASKKKVIVVLFGIKHPQVIQ